MKTERNICQLRALLTRALESKDSDLVKQYTYGLLMFQADRIKELEKELSARTLKEKYGKVA